MVYFQYFKVRKLAFLYYHPNLISKPLVCCLKSSELYLNLYPSFSISSLSRVTFKIRVKCQFVILPGPLSALQSLICVIALFVIRVPEKKSCQHSQEAD